jgi:hypothetical protein
MHAYIHNRYIQLITLWLRYCKSSTHTCAYIQNICIHTHTQSQTCHHSSVAELQLFYTHMCLHTNIYVYTHTESQTGHHCSVAVLQSWIAFGIAGMYVCMHVCMYVCMYVCIRTHVYVHTHTYTHTHRRRQYWSNIHSNCFNQMGGLRIYMSNICMFICNIDPTFIEIVLIR